VKKFLLSSTALAATGLAVAPAIAADAIKIGVGGFYTFYAVAAAISSDYATNAR
jgi:outer membrane protein OmpU